MAEAFNVLYIDDLSFRLLLRSVSVDAIIASLINDRNMAVDI